MRYRVGNGADWTEGPHDIADTTATIVGLDPDTEYEVQVRSSSATGHSEWTVLGVVRTNILILYDLFSLSLDLNGSEKDQNVRMLKVSSGRIVPIQVFGADIRDTRSLTVHVEYDSTQVVFEGFDPADALPCVHALVKRDSTVVEIGVASLGGRATVDSGLVGTLRFRMTEALSDTEIRLAGVELVRSDPLETMTRSVSVALQVAPPPDADFDDDGKVVFADFVLFAAAFGYGEGDAKYEAKYDLDGGIGFADFVIFAEGFGDTVNLALVFTPMQSVTYSVAENTAASAPIGDAIAATDADGDTLTYTLWGADAEHFAVDASTGQILTNGTYDFEKKKGYAVIVRASDGNGGHVIIVVDISVTVDE